MLKVKLRGSQLVKALIVLIFVSPFIYGPAARMHSFYWSHRFSRYQPVAESQVPELERFHFLDLSVCANADYHHNAFLPNPNSGGDHFPELQPGIYLSGDKVPFRVLESFSVTDKPSVITTGEDAYFSCRMLLLARPSQALHLALDGAWIDRRGSRIARIEVQYQDKTVMGKILVTREDVWTYQEKPSKAHIPKHLVLWEGIQGHKIVTVSVPLDGNKIPEAVELWTMPAVGKEGKQPAVAIFSVTQEFEGR